MEKLLYPISLLLLAIAIYLLIEYPTSQRMSLIAGALTMFGFILNIAAFSNTKKSK